MGSDCLAGAGKWLYGKWSSSTHYLPADCLPEQGDRDNDCASAGAACPLKSSALMKTAALLFFVYKITFA